MKKIITAIAITTATLGSYSIANASIFSNDDQRCHPPKPKLDLTQDQAKVLVNANIITHDKSKTDVIQKVETVKLTNNDTYYIVYAGDNNDSTNMFFVVDAQNGHVEVPGPKPRHKHHRHDNPRFAQNKMPDTQLKE